VKQRTPDEIRAMADRMRRNAMELAFQAGANGAHLGPALSIIDLCATLYGAVMRVDPKNPAWPDRDRFLLSKGHGSLGYYTALAEAGILTREQLFSFEADGGDLPGQPAMNPSLGIEVSSGSLGLGLSFGVGCALAGRRAGRDSNVYVLMGDGETNEGSVWEAALAAAHYRLGCLVAIVDCNGMQSDGRTSVVMSAGQMPLWRGFGWSTVAVDGHDIRAIYAALRDAGRRPEGTPLAVIARTVKGKGVSFMENNAEWHHNVLTRSRYEAALAELIAASMSR